MDKIKRVSKSVKCLLNEVQCVYREKLRDLEGDIKGSQEEILRVGGNHKINNFLWVLNCSLDMKSDK